MIRRSLGTKALYLLAAVFGLANGVASEALAQSEAGAAAPNQVAQMVDRIAATSDNHDRPFVIVDKIAAEVFVFDGRGKPLGSTAALVGLTPGDESEPGIGDRELSSIRPEERTTPAGRFVAAFGSVDDGRVLWVDYQTAIALHPVVTTNPREHRLERLATPSPADKRITYGCINVSAEFFDQVIRSSFKDGPGVVYILPETKPLADVFPALVPRAEPTTADAPEQAKDGRK